MNNFVEIYLKNRNKIFIAYNETSIYIILLDLCKFYFDNFYHCLLICFCLFKLIFCMRIKRIRNKFLKYLHVYSQRKYTIQKKIKRNIYIVI